MGFHQIPSCIATCFTSFLSIQTTVSDINYTESRMTLTEQIQKQLNALPPEKQGEVLDFVLFLQQRVVLSRPVKRHSLKKHPAFGSWKNRKIDPVKIQQDLRDEVLPASSASNSPLDVRSIESPVTTADILEAIRESRASGDRFV
jgi:hypothetical protein